MLSLSMATKQSKIRIISGQWRGRKLTFPARRSVRPTLDRTRETMFAWCQPYLHGARCLDVFAGSGAMGFEALSRGAADVVMLDRDPVVIQHLYQNREMLSAHAANIHRTHVPCDRTLLGTQPFDLVFLDPPFDQDLHRVVLAWLDAEDLLVDHAGIVCEWHLHHRPDFPIIYDLVKEKKSGQVGYGFLRYNRGHSVP